MFNDKTIHQLINAREGEQITSHVNNIVWSEPDNIENATMSINVINAFAKKHNIEPFYINDRTDLSKDILNYSHKLFKKNQ